MTKATKQGPTCGQVVMDGQGRLAAPPAHLPVGEGDSEELGDDVGGADDQGAEVGPLDLHRHCQWGGRSPAAVVGGRRCHSLSVNGRTVQVNDFGRTCMQRADPVLARACQHLDGGERFYKCALDIDAPDVLVELSENLVRLRTGEDGWRICPASLTARVPGKLTLTV